MIIIDDGKYRLYSFREELKFVDFSTVLLGREHSMYFKTPEDGVDYLLTCSDLSLESTLKLTKIKNEGFQNE